MKTTLLGHNYVPWRQVGRWMCIRCGQCCREFLVPLLTHEALKIYKSFGPLVVQVNGKIALAKKPDGSCVFLSYDGGIAKCLIYFERPGVCRIYPFYVKVGSSKGDDDALYVDDMGFKYRVYVDVNCPGSYKGPPIEPIMPKVIETWKRFYGWWLLGRP
ncbi:MAG: YkgJ family cysteine cluster protein [Candidatus Nezhaarchaeales archaeon]